MPHTPALKVDPIETERKRERHEICLTCIYSNITVLLSPCSVVTAIMSSVVTTSTGVPVSDNKNSLSAGPVGPLLLVDTVLVDKLAAFDRQRIPERVVHAKGAGAHGYFEVTVCAKSLRYPLHCPTTWLGVT